MITPMYHAAVSFTADSVIVESLRNVYGMQLEAENEAV